MEWRVFCGFWFLSISDSEIKPILSLRSSPFCSTRCVCLYVWVCCCSVFPDIWAGYFCRQIRNWMRLWVQWTYLPCTSPSVCVYLPWLPSTGELLFWICFKFQSFNSTMYFIIKYLTDKFNCRYSSITQLEYVKLMKYVFNEH